MRFPILHLAVLLLTACSSPAEPDPPAPPVAPAAYRLSDLRDDMQNPHAGSPQGVPSSFDWFAGPRLAWGNEPPADWTAMIPWGQVYLEAQAPLPVATRVHIGRIQAWYLSRRDSSWYLWVDTNRIEGAHYALDFQQDENLPASLRAEMGGGLSVAMKAGYNVHFWPAGGRVTIDPLDIGGVWVAIEARLIGEDSSAGPDPEARLLLSAGADYWKSLMAEWNQWTTNGDIGIGRFRFLTAGWQAFHMHSLSAAQLQAMPPPFPAE